MKAKILGMIALITIFIVFSGAALFTEFNDCPTDKTEKITKKHKELCPRMTNFMLDTIKSRRTVRKYTEETVPIEDVMKILDTARYAPTAGNQQPWKFLVITKRARIDALKAETVEWYKERLKKAGKTEEEITKGMKGLKIMVENVHSAPVYVMVLLKKDAKYPDYISHDGPIVASYILLAAKAMGYGTGYFTDYWPTEKLMEFLGVPDEYKFNCMIPIGVPFEEPKTPEKKPLKELVIMEEF